MDDKKRRFLNELREYYDYEFGDEVSEEQDSELYGLAYTTSEDDKEEYEMKYDFSDQAVIWYIDEEEVHRKDIDSDDLFKCIWFDSIFDYCDRDV